MSDIRFIMIGVVVITIGFIFLGVIGSEYTGITVQTNEFSTCYEYTDDQRTRIFRAIRSAVNEADNAFKGVVKEKKRFKL